MRNGNRKHLPSQRRTTEKRSGRRLFLESLDQRLVLTGSPMALASVEADLVADSVNQQAATTLIQPEGEGAMMTSRLTIFENGQPVTIPANVGVNADTSTANVFTDNADGTLQSMSDATLGDFFDIWRTDAGLAGNNPDAVLSATQLLTNVADTSNTVLMFVDGQISEEFDSHVLQGGEEIILVYGDDPAVSLNTNFGPIVVELFETETPGTVNNFLNYVNDGDYINSFFHRSATFSGASIIQGGGFRTTSNTFTSTAQLTSVPTDAPIQNEPGISNVRGTIAMAKTSDPDSATSQFFVNLNAANTLLDDPNNSGGFTVFGQVLDLRSSDEIKALPIDTSNSSPYGELPLSAESELAVIESIVGRGEISGIHFNDFNRSGSQDPGESGISGGTIYLDANNNGVLDPGELSTTTDADGRYLFQVDPGSYIVRAEVESGFSLTTPSPSDSYTPTVEIGREVSNRDFGIANDDPTANNSLSGFVYLDADRDGIRDTGEVGVPGAQITVSGAGITQTILTNITGAYSFTGLPAGTFQLVERQPTALIDGTDSTTVPNAVVGNDQITTIALAGGQDFAENNFGEIGIQSQYVGIAWFFARSGSQEVMFRETIAMGEELAGDFDLADTIQAGGTEVPDGTTFAPIANDDTFSVDENAMLTVPTASGVLSNDTDLDGDSLTAVILTQPASGTLSLSGDGSFTYTPDSDFFGVDTFTYQASDGISLSNEATVTITLNEVDSTNTFTLAESSASGTAVGQVAPTGDLGSEVVFTFDDPTLAPELEFAADDHIAGNPAGAVVLIEYLDFQCPVCRTFHPIVEQLEQNFPDDLVVVSRHLPLTSIHPNAFVAAVAAEAAGRQGAFDAFGDLLFENQPDWDNESDPQSFFESYATQLSLDLTQFRSDQADPALAARVTRDANVAASIGATGTPAFFLNGERIANPVSQAAFDAVVQAEVDQIDDVFQLNRRTGEITVEDSAALDFETTPSFSLIVNAIGLDGASEQVSVRVNLTNVNDVPPVAVADGYSVNENEALSVTTALGVLNNDSVGDGGPLSAQQVTAPTSGLFALNADGSFTYTPIADFNGTDTFTYLATDGTLTSAVTTVTITVDPVNSAPLTTVDSYTLDEDSSLTVNVADGVLINDSDPEGSSLTAVLVESPQNGTLSLNSDGSFTYTPVANFSATDAFTYAANDGERDSDATTVTLLVQVLEDTPVGVDDSYSVDQAGILNVPVATGVLVNDSDADADTLTALLISDPANGTLNLNANGSFSYDPNDTFAETDTFTYQASDGFFVSNTVTVAVTVATVDLVRIRLEAAKSDGTPIDTVGVGEGFFLNAFVEDVRPAPQGVFAAYFDVNYDSNIASVDGPIVYSTSFANGRSGDATTPGLIDEVGAFTQSTLGGGEALLFSVPFVASAAGTFDPVIDSADTFPAHDTLLRGINNAIPISLLDFVSDSIIVTSPPSGEGEGSGLAGYAASADEAFAAEDDWLLP